MIYLQSLFRAISSSRPDSYRELSGGSEHPDLPVGRVGGSLIIFRAISSVGSEHMPYKHRVGGSTPSSPTMVIKELQKCNSFFICLFAYYLHTYLIYIIL